MIRPSTDRVAVVDTSIHWIAIADDPPPRGRKVLLISRPAGVAVLSEWSPGTDWTHWHPLPTFQKVTP